MSEGDNWLLEAIVLNRQFPQCVRSGYCCKRSVCPYGEWSEEKNQCKHLGGDVPGEHACAIYEDIKDLPGSRDISPAFGAGCSSQTNDDRMKILRKLGNV